MQWGDLRHYLWGAPLDVAATVSFFGFVPLELAHTAQVCWVPLELAGGLWDVVYWDASSSYFGIL